MKKEYVLVVVGLSVLIMILIFGCCKKRKNLVYKGKYFDVIFKVKVGKQYKLSTEKKDLQSAREGAIIISDSWKIGIEENYDLSLPVYDKSFNDYMDANRKEKEFRRVSFSGMKGFLNYHSGYVRYEVNLSVSGVDKAFLQLDIYSTEDDKKLALAALNSADVQDILDHIEIKVK